MVYLEEMVLRGTVEHLDYLVKMEDLAHKVCLDKRAILVLMVNMA